DGAEQHHQEPARDGPALLEIDADCARRAEGAECIERAVRDVEDFHHPEDQGKPDRDDEQVGRIDEAIDQDGKGGQHDLPCSGLGKHPPADRASRRYVEPRLLNATRFTQLPAVLIDIESSGLRKSSGLRGEQMTMRSSIRDGRWPRCSGLRIGLTRSALGNTHSILPTTLLTQAFYAS